MAEIGMREMTAADARAIWDMIKAEPADYVNAFTPFQTLDQMLCSLTEAVADVYRCLTLDGSLVGYFMLRGLDQRFARPSFGIYVSSRAQGRGIARYALDSAAALCGSRGIEAIFLNVSETNHRARSVYERNGFQHIGRNPENGNLMMERRLRA